jgi:hypothetical protein
MPSRAAEWARSIEQIHLEEIDQYTGIMDEDFQFREPTPVPRPKWICAKGWLLLKGKLPPPQSRGAAIDYSGQTCHRFRPKPATLW